MPREESPTSKDGSLAFIGPTRNLHITKQSQVISLLLNLSVFMVVSQASFGLSASEYMLLCPFYRLPFLSKALLILTHVSFKNLWLSCPIIFRIIAIAFIGNPSSRRLHLVLNL